MSYDHAIEIYDRIYRRVDLDTILGHWARNSGRLHVYVHSPFCASICRFCYYKGVQLSFDTDAELYERFYSSYLPAAVAPFRPMLEAREVANYFFGGGTPSLMRADTMRSVFELFPRLRSVRSKTFEIHPAIWQDEQLDVLAEYGFNCGILGIQSFDAKVLERQRRIHAPFEQVARLARGVRERGMYVAADLIYRMDEIDADAIFARDLEQVAEIDADVISLQLNYDEGDSEEHTLRFFEHILSSGLGRTYGWEGGERISVERKKRMKCFRYVKRALPLQVYREDVFPFTATIDEASKLAADVRLPSVIGFGSYRNPRKNTFSNIRDAERTVEYIEVNEDWTPRYFITFEAEARDFFEELEKHFAQMETIGPPPPGIRILVSNKVPVTRENYIYRKTASMIDFSVSWDCTTPRIEAYVKQLKALFPTWQWDGL
jgi:hypothetical protein